MSLGDRSSNPDVNLHIVFLTEWTSQMKSSGHFPLWDYNELFNQAYVIASDLLTKKYQPSRGSVVTFLRGFLWGKVLYSYGKSFGWRYRDSKWKVFETPLDPSSDGAIEYDSFEYPPDLTEREKAVIEMRVGGHSLQSIARHFGFSSPNTVTYWIKNHIQPKFIGFVDED